MPPVGFESTISAGERLQTYALDRTTTGTSKHQKLVGSKSHMIRTILETGKVIKN
jgi:hypothetical protein